jgi:hypothetical protein
MKLQTWIIFTSTNSSRQLAVELRKLGYQHIQLKRGDKYAACLQMPSRKADANSDVMSNEFVASSWSGL